MATIPLPELGIKPPQQQNPLEEYGRLMQMQSLMQNQQLQRQEIQQRQIQIDQSNALMSSAKGVDWTKDDAFEKFISSAQATGKVNPQALSQMSLQRAQYKEQLAKTDTATLQATKEANNQLQGHIDAIKGISDPQERAKAAQTQASQILSSGLARDPQTQQIVQAMASGQHIPTDQELEVYENGLQDHTTQIESTLKQAQTGAEQAKAGESQAQTGRIQAEQQFYKQNPGYGAPGVPAETAQMVSSGVSPAQYPGFKAAQTAKAEQPYQLQRAAAEGAMHARIQAEIARGGNAALAGVPPHLVGPATAAAEKAGADYASAKTVSQELKDTLDAAKKGNVVAYQLLPEEGALQVVTANGIHRFNRTEIEQYGGGSLWQQLQGHIGKALSGKSIPDSVLKDMGSIQDIMAKGAETKYGNTLKSVNQYYNSKFEKVDMDAMPTGQAAPQAAPQGGGGAQHVIRLNNKRYQYNGSGDTADLKNYTELK